MKYLYKSKSASDIGFLVTSAKTIEIQLNNQDRYTIDERPFVIGCIEIILKIQNKLDYPRKYSVKISIDNNSLPVSIDDLESKFFSQFNSGFIICRSLARELVQVNKIIADKQKHLSKDERLSQEYCEIFYQVLNKLEKIFIKNRFPWLESVITKNKESLTYIQGLALNSIYSKNQIFIEMNTEGENFEKKHKYIKNSIICKQNDQSDEVYILESGKLEVLINDNVIDVIDQKFSIIGEMALLLSEKRNATLRAQEDSVLRVIRKNNFKAFCTKNNIFLKEIASNLATRIYSNCGILEQLNDSFNQKSSNFEITYSMQENHKIELFNLKDDIKNLSNKYDFEWLTRIYINLAKKIMEIDEN